MIIQILKSLKRKLFPASKTPVKNINGRNVIFIHINKTGGTSVFNTIGTNKSHLTACEIIDKIGENTWNSAYKFAAVRNPWDKVVSHYKYRVKTNQTDLGSNPIPFEDWVKQTYGQPKNPFYYDKPKMFQTQCDWLKDKNGLIEIDDVLRFENLSDDFKIVAKKLKINAELPHLNKTKQSDYRSFYSETTKKIIAEWFKEDIERFNYSFD